MNQAKYTSLYKILSVVSVIVASELLLLGKSKMIGWLVWAVIFGALFLLRFDFRRSFQALLLGIGIVGLVPITTDISFGHMLIMGTALAGAIVLPVHIMNKIGYAPTFPLGKVGDWPLKYYAYILFAGVFSYLLLPYYLASTGSYQNWDAIWDASHIVRLFIGTNALGIWDELFFIGVCLTLLRRHLPFFWANVVQAALWASFLYELGFHGWGPIAIFFFAITQGYLFKSVRSMLFIIAVHLTVDAMLFLSLLHLHNPAHLRIFLTAPF